MSDRPLRIALDARTLNTEHVRGIGKMLYELVRRTASTGAIEWHLLADRPDRPIHAPDPACRVEVWETRGYRFHSWEQWSLPRAAERIEADLLHAPGTSAPWWQPVPTVATVHDTIPWQKRDGADTFDPYRDWLLPATYHRAAAIITISQNSRKDILARWPKLKPKLHVVSLGVDERYLEAEPDHAPIVIGDRVVTQPYLLYLGGADPRKRVMWALQAWWKGAADRTLLVICGLEPSAHADVRRGVPRELQDKVIIAPFMDEADMPRLYMRAAAVLYPSLYEGFGLPVVEAQAVGTPVLFSAVGSLGELNGPGAIMLPVDDLPAWARTVATLLDSRRVGAGPDRIARAWAQQYSWEAFVERTLAVYDSVGTHTAHPNQDRDLRHGATP
jgi:glycosyltransferase involved in cell wall biosynthesis